MAPRKMDTVPRAEKLISSVRESIEEAFAGSGSLYPAHSKSLLVEDYRWAFEELGHKFSVSAKWDSWFDELLIGIYGDSRGIAGPLRTDLIRNLDLWSEIWDEGSEIHSTIESLLSNVAEVESTIWQERAIELHHNANKLTTNALTHYTAMNETRGKLEYGVDCINIELETLKFGWVNFAKEVCKDDESVLDPDKDWFPHLNKWSDFIDMCDCSLQRSQLALDRFKVLINQLCQLPHILSQLPATLDIEDTVLTGDIDNYKTELCEFIDTLLDPWIKLENCPTWERKDHRPHTIAECGQARYDIRRFGGSLEPNPISDNSGSEDVQFGMTSFSSNANNGSSIAIPVVDKLDYENAENDNQRHKKRDDEMTSYDVKLSWVGTPSKIHERVQFGWAIVTFNHQDCEFEYMSMDKEEQRGAGSTEQIPGLGQAHQWLVKFPRPFLNSAISVHPWIMYVVPKATEHHALSSSKADNDMAFKPQPEEMGAVIEVGKVSSESFTLHALFPLEARISRIKVGYVAFEEENMINGFYIEQESLNVLPNANSSSESQRFKPTYHQFSVGKFRRRPAIAAMIKGFWITGLSDFGVDTSLAVTCDGFVIQGNSKGNSVIKELQWQVLAIGNEE